MILLRFDLACGTTTRDYGVPPYYRPYQQSMNSRGITWLSAGMCHLHKCHSENRNFAHFTDFNSLGEGTCPGAGQSLVRVQAYTWLSAKDWSLIQVISLTDQRSALYMLLMQGKADSLFNPVRPFM